MECGGKKTCCEEANVNKNERFGLKEQVDCAHCLIYLKACADMPDTRLFSLISGESTAATGLCRITFILSASRPRQQKRLPFHLLTLTTFLRQGPANLFSNDLPSSSQHRKCQVARLFLQPRRTMTTTHLMAIHLQTARVKLNSQNPRVHTIAPLLSPVRSRVLHL